MGFSGEELRQHPRVPLLLQVEYPDREGFLADSTENLSAAGAFVRTERAFQIGERVPLKLSFPGLLEGIEVLGEVVWIREAKEGQPRGVGFRIPSDRPDDLVKLSEVLKATGHVKEARQSYRILLVEDNPHLMELYEYVMRKLAKSDQLQIEVAVAKDGHDAFQQLTAGSFDLIVTDLFMPVLDGFALLQKIRADPKLKDLPVVAISAGGSDAQEQARRAGASIYLRKPVRFVEVVETIKALLKL